MSETTTVAIDKSTWGPGEWQNEPDRVDFVHMGLACMAIRHDTHGHWCGYVGVPHEHPYYSKPYNDVDAEFHGGLTYSNKCKGSVCHVPQPGMPDDVWWLGGDFAHCFDISPGMLARLREIGIADRIHGGETYRALPYVLSEIKSLAEQLSFVK